MIAFDIFRQELRASLQQRAERRSPSDIGVTRETTERETTLKRLADDAGNLDLHVFLLFELMLTHTQYARHYLARREDLLDQIGMSYRPSSATKLVRWLTIQSMRVVYPDQGDCPRQLRQSWIRPFHPYQGSVRPR